ncbi:MAG TPA: hypothetical protein VFX03_07570 [Thermomicrobiales bacterium]|nr:hypothetical protein [Thermomicrobiales bacterium]
MTLEIPVAVTPRIEDALTELEGLIRRAFPEATFTVGEGEDPEGVYLTATVDVEDRGAVIDVFLERLIELQIDDGLPIFVIPARPPARNAALLNSKVAPRRV